MATALKDIQFTKPVLVGEANANNGTTYTLGSHDVLGPIAQESFTPPGDGSSQTMWGFDGVAEYAKVANHATGAGALDFGDGALSIGSVSVGLLPAPSFGSVSGSWSDLSNYLNYLTTALQDIQGKSIVVVSNS